MFGSSGMISVLGLSVLVLLNSSRLSRLTLVFISLYFLNVVILNASVLLLFVNGVLAASSVQCKMGLLELFFRIIAMWGGVRFPDEVGESALRAGSSLFWVVSFYRPSSAFFFSSSFLRSLFFSLSFLFPMFLAAGLCAPPQLQRQWTTSDTKKNLLLMHILWKPWTAVSSMLGACQWCVQKPACSLSTSLSLSL